MHGRRHGMTLLEVLIAMSIFLVLGGALILFLRVGIQTWRTGEARREAYERAQAILDGMAEDVSATFPDPSHGTGGVVDVVFLSDYDDRGRQRLRFVRSLAGEMRHRITQEAGSLTGGLAEYDYIDDALEAKSRVLRAPGGLQEVAYLLDPRPESELLWRGVKSPIGGPGTLFEDDNLYNWQPTKEDPLPLHRSRPFTDGVLYIEYNFWGADTETWAVGDESGSPATSWDSTRGISPPNAATRHEHRDDVFPSRVQIVVTLRPSHRVRLARLTRVLDASATEISVDTTENYPDGAFQYIRIGTEWIRYERKEGRSFLLGEKGRGARGTVPRTHEAGSEVLYGYTFSRVARIPGSRYSQWGKP